MKRKKPKSVKSKTWKLHLQIIENNKKILKEKKKNPLYVPDWIDELIEKS